MGKGNDIKLHKQIEFPHSLGLLYSAFTAFLGFEVNEGEYKVMGMAPYGEPRYVDKVWKLIHQNRDGSFSLDMDYFCFHHSTEQTYNSKFAALFGEPRPAKMLFFTEERAFRNTSASRRPTMNELSQAEPALRRHRGQHPEGDRRSAGRHGARICTRRPA